MTGQQVDEVHGVPVVEQPLGVHPRRAAHVEHPGVGGQVATDDLLHPRQLQPAEALTQARVLVVEGVVVVVDGGLLHRCNLRGRCGRVHGDIRQLTTPLSR